MRCHVTSIFPVFKQSFHLPNSSSAERFNLHFIRDNFLLRSGANLNVADADGRTALHIAAENGFADSISKLLDCGADPLLTTKHKNFTPLVCALYKWELKAAELLLSPQSVQCLTEYGLNPLHYAIWVMDKGFINKVLALGVDINLADEEGWTSYHWACDCDEEEDALRMASCAHSHGADINACTEDGRQPISVAIKKGHLKLCQQLVAHGAVPFNTHGILHLSIAIEFGHVELTKWLISQYPDLQRVENPFGCRPIHYAMFSDVPEMHNYALDMCGDLTFDCMECGTLLNEACRHGRHHVVKKIHNLGTTGKFKLCQISSKTCSPPLITAIINCSLECVEALLDASADTEIKTEHWDAPLLMACKYGRTEIAKLLIRKGAKLFQTDKDGKLVSAIEAAKDHNPLRRWLEENVSKFGNGLIGEQESSGDAEEVSLADLALEC